MITHKIGLRDIFTSILYTTYSQVNVTNTIANNKLVNIYRAFEFEITNVYIHDSLLMWHDNIFTILVTRKPTFKNKPVFQKPESTMIGRISEMY